MSGAIASFARNTGPAVSIAGGNITDNVIDPALGSATIQFDNTGNENHTADIISSTKWLHRGAVADFEIRATLNSGALSSGTTGVWQSLATSRSWNVSRSSPGTSSANITFEIRRASDLAVLATKNALLTVNSSV